jgi:ribonuclease J
MVPGTDIAFTPYEVDHSVPASFAFIVSAGGKKIAYTGDLRMHGRRHHLTDGFLQALRDADIDVLLCEGTHVLPDGEDAEAALLKQAEEFYTAKLGGGGPRPIKVPCETEDELEAHLSSIIAKERGLVVVETPAIDLDRVFSVWKAAQANGRVLILPSRLAYIILEARRRTSIEYLPEIQGSGLYLSQHKMRADKRGPADPLDAEELLEGRRQWQQQLAANWTREGGLVVGLPQGRRFIADHPDAYVVCTPRAANLLSELSYGTQRFPMTLVMARTAPFNLPMVEDVARIQQWLNLLRSESYYQLHVSGHVTDGDVRKLIDAAEPDRVIPIHTRWPEAFGRWHDRVEHTLTDGIPNTIE